MFRCFRRVLRAPHEVLLFLSLTSLVLLFLRSSHLFSRYRDVPASEADFQVTDTPTTTRIVEKVVEKIVEKVKKEIVTKFVYVTKPPEIQTKLVYVTQSPVTAVTTVSTPSEYIKLDNADLRGGDMACQTQEKCSVFRVRSPEHAQMLCEWYGDRCKAFVFFMKSAELYLKSDITGKIESLPGRSVYIKKAHSKGIKLPLNNMCAVATDVERSSSQSNCRLVELNPFDVSIMKYINKPDKALECRGVPLTRYKSGQLKIIRPSKDYSITAVAYEPIQRIPFTDWGFKMGTTSKLDPLQDKFNLNDEFLHVTMNTSQGKYEAYHAQVVGKDEVVTRAKKPGGLPLNIMIVGFDSLSTAQFRRAFPGAYAYLKDELNSVFMKGYSIVGDGTTPALTAILTGMFEQELPEARRGYDKSKPVDRWPWIFKTLKSHGYATMFSEDMPGYGAFNYRLHGFKNPPTDHFARYFWEAAKLTSPYCIWTTPQHRIHFDYIESFFDAYPETPKFGFSFLTEVSHNNLHSVFYAGEDFLQLVKKFQEKNFLNNTMFIVLGDHGFRYGDARATLQGKLEERLPFLSVTLPAWFEKSYPQLVRNLRKNSNKVTSPFDLHATFHHMLTYPQLPKNMTFGLSLFDDIPASRDCGQAGVAEHYCPCLQWKAADQSHVHIQKSAEAVVEFINNLTSSDERSARLCYRLKLKEILTGYQQIQNQKFQRYLGSADSDGRVPEFAKGKVRANECNYQVQIRTQPGGGLFEAPLRFRDGRFTVSGDISRINMYGEQPRCVLDTRPDLRKYCLCKDYAATQTPTT